MWRALEKRLRTRSNDCGKSRAGRLPTCSTNLLATGLHVDLCLLVGGPLQIAGPPKIKVLDIMRRGRSSGNAVVGYHTGTLEACASFGSNISRLHWTETALLEREANIITQEGDAIRGFNSV